MTLKELMRLAYNAGALDAAEPYRVDAGRNWSQWWKEYGEERHDDYLASEEPPHPADPDSRDRP